MPRRPLAETEPRSACPLACALDLLGDRWTLLVLRDVLLFRKSLFQEFLDSPEGISSNTLTERLKRLERHGLLRREAYQERPVRSRYVPTPKGRDLVPLLREAIVWGARHAPGAMQPTPEQLAGLDALVEQARAARDDALR
ncbi:MAG: helix-turn-helix transcriptional regulator [Planctomycetes bacterium]|nr:helix-turn-helix transcriptional regulator [Planctomycetota bacterium]